MKIYRRSINSANDIGYSDYNDPRLQPPEYDEGQEIAEFDETIEIELDKETIIVDKDGIWDYKSTKWAEGGGRWGYWYSEEYRDLAIADETDIVQDFDEIVEPYMPADPGVYQISCKAQLIYTVSDLKEYEDDYDISIDVDFADINFDSSKSVVSDFVFSKIS